MSDAISRAIANAKLEGSPGGATITLEEAQSILQDALAANVAPQEVIAALKEAGFTPPAPPASESPPAPGPPAPGPPAPGSPASARPNGDAPPNAGARPNASAPPSAGAPPTDGAAAGPQARRTSSEAPPPQAPPRPGVPVVNAESVQPEKPQKKGFWQKIIDILRELFTLGRANTVTFDDKLGKGELKDLERQAQRLATTDGFMPSYQAHGQPMGTLDVTTLRRDVHDALRAAYPDLKSDGIERRTDVMVRTIQAQLKDVGRSGGQTPPVVPATPRPWLTARVGAVELRAPRAALGDIDLAAAVQRTAASIPATGAGRWTAAAGKLTTTAGHEVQVEVVASRAQADGAVAWETALRLGAPPTGKVVPKEIVDKLLDGRPLGLAPFYGWLMQQELVPPVKPEDRDELAAEIFQRLQGQPVTVDPPAPAPRAEGPGAAPPDGPGGPGDVPRGAAAPVGAPTAPRVGAPPGGPAAPAGGPPSTPAEASPVVAPQPPRG